MMQARQHRQTARRLSLRGRTATLGVGWLAVSIIAAGCGSAASTHTAQPVVISTVESATHGTILVSGKALYTLIPSQTACTAECLKIWPALLLPKGVTSATAGPGVSASNLGTVQRGGVLQVTYSGQPLYFFRGDTTVGQVNGNVTDTWGTWSDVATAVPAAASPAPASLPPVTSAPVPTTASPTPTTVRPTPTTARLTPTTAAPTPTTAAPTPTTEAPTTTTTAPASGGAGF